MASARRVVKPVPRTGDWPCTFLLSRTCDTSVRGRAEWLTGDQAYVVVPYGTARTVREKWNAVAIIPDGKAPSRSRELRMQAELVSAESVQCPEGDREGLVLRLSGLGERTLSELANAFPRA